MASRFALYFALVQSCQDDVPHRSASSLDTPSRSASFSIPPQIPWPKQHTPSGAVAGRFHFKASAAWISEFSELVFEDALQPLSRLPLAKILELNLPNLLLPETIFDEYLELSLSLVTLLDQARLLLGTGYNIRYTRGFFDPLAEKVVRQLVLPYSNDFFNRPDHLRLWFSRGYNFNHWLVRVL